jgi:site-specific DNA recombinase
MNPKRVILYARSATFKKPEEDNSVDMQLRKLREYACKHKYEVLTEFVDEGVSGNRIDHPGLQNMMAMALKQSEVVDAILVGDLNRLTRDRRLFRSLKDRLYEDGIDIVSIYAPGEIVNRPSREDIVCRLILECLMDFLDTCD